MTGFLIVIAVLVLMAAGYRRWARGPQPPSTRGGDSYRDIKSEAQHRPDSFGMGSSGWEGPPQ